MGTASSLRRSIPLLVLACGALLLFALQPRFPATDLAAERSSATCLSNLSQISRAYAQYALDYDGKIPRGVDPEDRYDQQTWRDNEQYDSQFYEASQHAPWLHRLLRPYLKSAEVFYCPADKGWTVSRLSQSNTRVGVGGFRLRNVHPSLFKRYGTSYLSWSKYGFALNTAADIPNPGRTVLLFDGDLWHSSADKELINGLFADGHAQTMTSDEFAEFSQD